MDLNYVREGEGEPLLLLHGLGGSIGVWGPVIEPLAEHRDVIVPDLPGFGGSRLPEGFDSRAPSHARAVIDFCASIGIERPHVAGNSLGGWVALEMARQEAAASVCCISPAGLWRRPLGSRSGPDGRRGARTLAPLVRGLLSTSAGRKALLGSVFARPELLSGAEARAIFDSWLASPGYVASNNEMRSGIFEAIDEIDVPTTIAWGSLDRLVGAPRPERMPPGARYVELTDCGHTPTWDCTDRLVELILEASSSTIAR